MNSSLFNLSSINFKILAKSALSNLLSKIVFISSLSDFNFKELKTYSLSAFLSKIFLISFSLFSIIFISFLSTNTSIF